MNRFVELLHHRFFRVFDDFVQYLSLVQCEHHQYAYAASGRLDALFVHLEVTYANQMMCAGYQWLMCCVMRI